MSDSSQSTMTDGLFIDWTMAGIVIGIVGFVIITGLITAIIVCYLHRREHQKKSSSPRDPEEPPGEVYCTAEPAGENKPALDPALETTPVTAPDSYPETNPDVARKTATNPVFVAVPESTPNPEESSSHSEAVYSTVDESKEKKIKDLTNSEIFEKDPVQKTFSFTNDDVYAKIDKNRKSRKSGIVRHSGETVMVENDVIYANGDVTNSVTKRHTDSYDDVKDDAKDKIDVIVKNKMEKNANFESSQNAMKKHFEEATYESLDDMKF